MVLSSWTNRFSLGGLLSLVIIFSGSLVGCSTPKPDSTFIPATPPHPSSDVNTFRGNFARTGWMPGPGPSGPDVSPKWIVETDAPVNTSPVVVDETLYIRGSNGQLYAVDKERGVIRWETTVTNYIASRSPIAASPTVANGMVYVGVQALNAQTGELIWDASEQLSDVSEQDQTYKSFVSAVASAPAVHDKIVYITAGRRTVALDAKSGVLRWQEGYRTYLSAPTVVANRVFGGNSEVQYRSLSPPRRDGVVYARCAGDGTLLWTFDAAEHNPAFFFPNSMGKSTISDVADSSCAQSSPNASSSESEPPTSFTSSHSATLDSKVLLGAPTAAAANGMLFYTQADDWAYLNGRIDPGIVYALDARTGAAVWTFDPALDAESVARWPKIDVDAPPHIISSPAVANETVYIGTETGAIHALDAQTGDVRWTTKLSGAVRSSPAITGEMLYVGSTDGHLYALDVATGSVTWQFATDGPIISSPAVTGGTIYFGSHDGRIYALE